MSEERRGIFVIDLLRSFYGSDAADCGKSACTLLGAICMEYDRFWCRRPVRWAVRTIEITTGLSRSSIYEARKRLVDAGWLRFEEGENRKKAASYTPLLPKDAENIQYGHVDPFDIRSYVDELDTNTVHSLYEYLTNSIRNLDSNAFETLLKRTLYIPYPNLVLNPIPEDPDGDEEPDSKLAGFANAWDRYEYKDKKKNALAAWAKLSRDDKLAAYRAMPFYVAVTHPTGEGGKTMRAMFASWINARRWEDGSIVQAMEAARNPPPPQIKLNPNGTIPRDL